MSSWTKEVAITELRNLTSEISALKQTQAFSAPHTAWLHKCIAFFRQVFGDESQYTIGFISLDWQDTSTFLVDFRYDVDRQIAHKHHQTYLRHLEMAQGLFIAAQYELEREENIATVYRGKSTGPETSAIIQIINLAEHKLRKVIRDRPTKEKEVQDAFENLLVGADVEYQREFPHIEYSSKNYIPDFTMSKLDLAIEIKLCKEGDEKAFIAQINDDILAYQTQFGNILFVIYDIGSIRDVDKFSASFENHKNVVVKVAKH